MDEDDPDLWRELRPIKKAYVQIKKQPAQTLKQHHYLFLESDDVEPMGVLDRDADEWLIRLFRPTPDWANLKEWGYDPKIGEVNEDSSS